MLTAWCVLFGISVVYGAAFDDDSRIVNGVPARLGEFPYQVSLQVHGGLFCGGTIIGQKEVLTAAHCITSKNFNFWPNDLSVVVGSVDLSNPYTPGTRYLVSNLKVHEYYRHNTPGWPHDIAILKLASPIQYNQYVQPARLPKIGDVLQRNQVAVVSGYGKFFSTGRMSPVLYKTQVHIDSNENCQRFYREPISKTSICTYHTKPVGFCKGDSGGPLAVGGTVVGIVSFSLGNGCADVGTFSQVYTRISDYINWIQYWQKFMYNVRVLSVVVDSADLRSLVGSRHQVSAMKIHENYHPKNGWSNDITLLRLASPLVFNKFVGPAILPQRREDGKIGQSAVVSGFGQTNKNSPLSPILYKTQVFIESNAECQRQYYYSDHIRPTNICTRHPNKFTGFCRGDFGGPLNVNGKVVGLVSFSLDYGCASPAKTPQVYTRLSAYVDWISHW